MKPVNGQYVTVHYVCMSLDGKTVYDSSVRKGRPFTFKLGNGEVIKGWDHGVAQMSLGQKAKLVCSPDFAYGAKGAAGVIPPNASLLFEVEVLKIQDKPDTQQ